jgi:hypothetical protein
MAKHESAAEAAQKNAPAAASRRVQVGDMTGRGSGTGTDADVGAGVSGAGSLGRTGRSIENDARVGSHAGSGSDRDVPAGKLGHSASQHGSDKNAGNTNVTGTSKSLGGNYGAGNAQSVNVNGGTVGVGSVVPGQVAYGRNVASSQQVSTGGGSAMGNRGDVPHHMADQHTTYNNYGAANAGSVVGGSSSSSSVGGNQVNIVGNQQKDVDTKQSDSPAFTPGQGGHDNADTGHIRGAQPGEEHGKDSSVRGRAGTNHDAADTDSDSDFI